MKTITSQSNTVHIAGGKSACCGREPVLCGMHFKPDTNPVVDGVDPSCLHCIAVDAHAENIRSAIQALQKETGNANVKMDQVVERLGIPRIEAEMAVGFASFLGWGSPDHVYVSAMAAPVVAAMSK